MHFARQFLDDAVLNWQLSWTLPSTQSGGSSNPSTIPSCASSSFSLSDIGGANAASYCGGSGEAAGDMNTRAHGKAAARSGQQRAMLSSSGHGFDPRDYDWSCPTDEDRPWEFWPTIPAGIPIWDSDGSLQVDQLYSQGDFEQDKEGVVICKHRGPCSICFIEAEASQGFATFACGLHFYCTTCLEKYFRERIHVGVVPVCPTDGCKARATFQLCQQLLARPDFEQYLLLSLRREGRLQACPSCHESMYVNDRATGATASVICVQCKQRVCRSCGLPWHAANTCDEMRGQLQRRRQRKNSREFKELCQVLGFKCCPCCGSACEKSDPAACDHMTCVRCGFEFCWVCLVDRAVVYAHGNHHHLFDCPHYRPYLGAPEYKPEACKRCLTRRRACTPPPQIVVNSPASSRFAIGGCFLAGWSIS